MSHEGFTTSDRMLGRVSSWGALIVGLVYTVFAVLYMVSFPASSQASFSDPFRPVASMLLIPVAALMVASMAAVYAYAPPQRKAYGLLALVFMCFAMGSTTLINLASFIILTHPAEMANASWLTLFFPDRKPGVVGSLDLAAWGWFFGLSMITAAPVFREGRLEKVLRALMFLTGILTIAGWTLMLLLPSALVLALILQGLGWGVLILVVWFLLARAFDLAIPVEEGTKEGEGHGPRDA